jgi:hypothetical protein
MKRPIQIVRCVVGVGLLGTLGCNQSAPPAAAVVPVAANEAKADPAPKEKPAEVAKADLPPLADGGAFPFPDDAGGKALQKALTPSAPAAMPVGAPVAPKERKLPAYLNVPSPPLPDAASIPPRLGLPQNKPVQPSPLPERVPSDFGGTVPVLPGRSELPVGPLTRQEGVDLSKPAPLPTLGTRVADRAPLADPTVEFTAQSVVSTVLPLRTEPTGFLRITLPDPFENSEAARPRTPVVEDPNKSLPRSR